MEMSALRKKTIFVTTVIFLTLAAGLYGKEHPHLYFTRSDLPELRREATGAKSFQFDRLKSWGDLNLGKKPPQDIASLELQHEVSFSTITNYGFLYQLTGGPKYLNAGQQWIEALLSLPTGSGSDYLIGIFAASLAHGYDLFYQGLEPDIRKALVEKLIDVLQVTRHGAVHHWWGGIYTHHDFWIPVAGMGIAALCLTGEYSEADTIVGFAVGELSRAIRLFGERGYWPEGVADWVYGMAPTLMFFDALARAGGPNFYAQPWMKATARSRLQHWLPDDTYMYIGDSYRSGRYGTLGSVSAHLLMRLAGRYRDGHAQWLALREAALDSAGPCDLALEAPYSFGIQRLLPEREMNGLAWQFLWYDPSVKPVAPDTLPLDALYPNWDTAIFRAGWGPEDPVLAFAGGHMLGRVATRTWKAGLSKLPLGLTHTHQNAGSVYLWADGRFPLAPPGYGGRDGRFHSTVMVDGQGQPFDPRHRAELMAFETAGFWATATMDLTGAYPQEIKLDSFTRDLLYLKPRTILLVDRLVTTDLMKKYTRRYEWLLHTDATLAEWRAGGDSLAAVLRTGGDPVLVGRIFPSVRHFFEHQSMNLPDGTPMTRALSVTLIGRLYPEKVEIATVLHVPHKNENTDWLKGIICLRNEQATSIILPAVGSGKSRGAVFAAGDSLALAPEVLNCDFVLVTGISAGKTYGLRKDRETGRRGAILLPEVAGVYKSSAAGNIEIKKQ